MHRLIGINWTKPLEDGDVFHLPTISFLPGEEVIFEDKADAALVVNGYNEDATNNSVRIELRRKGTTYALILRCYELQRNMLYYPKLVWEDERSTQEI